MNPRLDDPTAFEPAQLAALDDPYPVFRALHSAGAAIRTASGLWCVIGYEVADAVLRDARFRSGPLAERFRQLLPAGAAHDELSHRINFLDPPAHPRVRGLVARAFTPAQTIRSVVDAVLAGAPAVIPVLPVADTVKTVDDAGMITGTQPREMLRAASRRAVRTLSFIEISLRNGLRRLRRCWA